MFAHTEIVRNKNEIKVNTAGWGYRTYEHGDQTSCYTNHGVYSNNKIEKDVEKRRIFCLARINTSGLVPEDFVPTYLMTS